jgi:hypothetical protein
VSGSSQRALFTEDLEPDADPADSWSTEPDVMAVVHGFWPDGIVLDSCTNHHAIALGFVRALVAWTKRDNCLTQPTWDVHGLVKRPRTTCWLQPPYGRDGAPIIACWARRWDAGETHETLALVRLDTSTDAWRTLASRASSVVLFRRRLAHYEAGVRQDGSNFCSAMLLMTRADPTVRHRALEAAVGDLGDVYRKR